jgi:hypothetical protein
MAELLVNVKLGFRAPMRGYIAEPYWPETESVVNILKESGMSRCRSDKTRRQALEKTLNQRGLSMKQWEALRVKSSRPFYTENGTGARIIIPSEQMAAALTCICYQMPRSQQPCEPNNLRTAIVIPAPFQVTPEKTAPDAVWARVVQPKDGKGNPLSNQRATRTSHYICDFDAVGVLEIDSSFVDPESVRQALVWGGKRVGIGASRKMGWGRFTVEQFEVQE